jgi:hypothetical protein
MLRGGTVQFAVQHEVDASPTEQVHRLRTMAADIVQFQTAQMLTQPTGDLFVNREFDELDAIECRRRRQDRCSGFGLHQRPPRAIIRAGAARNSSLNTSRDSGPR